jgi:quinolinate synthase
MAETAKILNPEKTVLIPAQKAGCSLAESISVEDIRRLKERFPGMPVVAYVNTYADVKAEVDICCTSGNAEQVVKSLHTDKVIFLPDEYLAANVARELGWSIAYPDLDSPLTEEEQEAQIIGWHGRCEVHERFTVADVQGIRQQFPDVIILAHPECNPDVTAIVDYTGSTSGMIKYVEETNAPRYLLLTECAMGDNIAAANPDKEMLRLCSVRCPYMNMITLEDTLKALQHMQYKVHVPEDVRIRAASSVERMVKIG